MIMPTHRNLLLATVAVLALAAMAPQAHAATTCKLMMDNKCVDGNPVIETSPVLRAIAEKQAREHNQREETQKRLFKDARDGLTDANDAKGATPRDIAREVQDKLHGRGGTDISTYQGGDAGQFVSDATAAGIAPEAAAQQVQEVQLNHMQETQLQNADALARSGALDMTPENDIGSKEAKLLAAIADKKTAADALEARIAATTNLTQRVALKSVLMKTKAELAELNKQLTALRHAGTPLDTAQEAVKKPLPINKYNPQPQVLPETALNEMKKQQAAVTKIATLEREIADLERKKKMMPPGVGAIYQKNIEKKRAEVNQLQAQLAVK